MERIWGLNKEVADVSYRIGIDEINGHVNVSMSSRSFAESGAPMDFVAMRIMQYEAVEMALAILSRYDYNVAGILGNVAIAKEAIASLAGALNEYLDKAKE